jgi:GNAT superfamily N-acetyltransferase
MSQRLATLDDLDAIFTIDDDTGPLFASAGIVVDYPPEHPFVIAERAGWEASVRAGNTIVHVEHGVPVGVAALGTVDDAPYLDQLSVRRAAMGRGIGGALLASAIARAGAELWLNTYGHLPWNRPFYERRGFVLVPEADWGAEMREIIADQRATLPRPDQRVVMVRRDPSRETVA